MIEGMVKVHRTCVPLPCVPLPGRLRGGFACGELCWWRPHLMRPRSASCVRFDHGLAHLLMCDRSCWSAYVGLQYSVESKVTDWVTTVVVSCDFLHPGVRCAESPTSKIIYGLRGSPHSPFRLVSRARGVRIIIVVVLSFDFCHVRRVLAMKVETKSRKAYNYCEPD